MVTVSPSEIVASMTPSVMSVPATDTMEPIEPPATPPSVKSPNAAALSAIFWSAVITI